MSTASIPLPQDTPARQMLHASCVAHGTGAVVILGPSGAGKSSLAMQLIGLGAVLVADDQTCLERCPDGLWAQAPKALSGMIEVRGMGLLTSPAVTRARVTLAVDLSRDEPDRLPPRREKALLGLSIPLLYKVPHAAFAPAILQYLQGGRCA